MREINWSQLADIATVISALAVITATLFAGIEWKKEKRRLSKERMDEQMRLDALAFEGQHADYIKILELTTHYPELDLADYALPDPPELSSIKLAQAHGIFLIWAAMVQRAYVLYNQSSDRAKQAQWKGWEIYICERMSRKNFGEYWKLYRHQFDADFQKYMMGITKD